MTRLPLKTINERLKVDIDKELLIIYMEESERQKNIYEQFIKKATGLSEITQKKVKDKYGVAILEDINDEKLVRALNLYFIYKGTYETCNSVLNKINEGTLKPEIYETKTGNITCKNHTFNHIKNSKLAKLLGYKDYIKFNTAIELEEFIIKYFKLFVQTEVRSSYFIRSNTLFFTVDIQSYKIAYYNSKDRKEYIDTCSKFKDETYELSMELLADANVMSNQNSTFYDIYNRFIDFTLGLQIQGYEGTPQFKEFYKIVNDDFMKDENDKANKFHLLKVSYLYNSQNIRYE